MPRPTQPKLSREQIARAALALVDRDGSEGASIRRVADRLKVHPTSLYNHVPNLAALIEDVRALVSSRIDSSALRDREWEEGLLLWARSYRDAFRRHPKTIPLLMSHRSSAPLLMSQYEDFAVAAERVGWTSDDILPLLTAFESFILGSVLDMSGPSVMFDPTGQEEDVPRFAAAYATLSDHDPGDPVATRAFELGLSLLITGARPRVD
ncbi:TetR/AcrR family transcriptional regulator C-terminal domain-containing protein [Microbacterium sp. KSW2-29]|uniref:TetR/AcrR family transcriptional regulator C-terminal domain-containing protein n=1 Tax=Microbacterium phycohabitans TaxID=3075993 RepID=A0ABU3SJ77_9MICO|nr:TetR/AcrR family transcriptional regulator C-terminal domain-containing protein [Microbacterium sp. KSW2-29]MDU0344851.1 TetR/AcrR family transcriptional regulator C-terminal domain-containing protein [Microbacterium sp. KSW2-29]